MFRNNSNDGSTSFSMALFLFSDGDLFEKETIVREGNRVRQDYVKMTNDTFISSQSTYTTSDNGELDQEVLLSMGTFLAMERILSGIPSLVSSSSVSQSLTKEKVKSPQPVHNYKAFLDRLMNEADLEEKASSTNSSEWSSDDESVDHSNRSYSSYSDSDSDYSIGEECEQELNADSDHSSDSEEKEKSRVNTQGKRLQSSYKKLNDFFKEEIKNRNASAVTVSLQDSYSDLESDDENEEKTIRALGRMYYSQVEPRFRTDNPELMRSYEKINGFFSAHPSTHASQASRKAEHGKEKEVSTTPSLRSSQG